MDEGLFHRMACKRITAVIHIPPRWIFSSWTYNLTALKSLREENTGLYSPPHPHPPPPPPPYAHTHTTCLLSGPSMALCVRVCCSLNGSEGTCGQEWLLSSSQRPLQAISPKAEFMEVWSGTGNPALAPLWVRAHMLSGQQSAWLPRLCFPFS